MSRNSMISYSLPRQKPQQAIFVKLILSYSGFGYVQGENLILNFSGPRHESRHIMYKKDNLGGGTMTNQDLEQLIADLINVKKAILQLNFILTLIQAEIVRLTAEGNNQEEIDALVQASFIITNVILELAIIINLIQAEIARLIEEEAA